MTDTPSTITLISVADAASLAGVTPKTVRRYISTGQLPAYRMGERLIRLRRDDVVALLRPIPTLGGAA